MRTQNVFFLLIILLPVVLSSVVYAKGEHNLLKVSVLDIGQGDSIYVQAPNGRQMIIDGGPGDALMRALPPVMPFGDHSIDVIVVTNPDADHYSGFISLLKRYDVGAVIEAGTHSDTAMYKALQAAIKKEGAPHILARKGMSIVLDKTNGVAFNILFPDRDVSNWTTNDGSIVGKLVYGTTSFMMMGDATKRTEGIVIANNDKSVLDSDVLKLGHHGSHTSSGTPWLAAVTPSEAVYSAGCNNRYGHPHADVIARLDSLKILHYGTCEHGTVTVESDGTKLATNFGKQ